MATNQLELGPSFVPPAGRPLDHEPTEGGTQESPESFSLDALRKVVTRTVRLKNGQTASTDIRLAQVPRKRNLTQEELSALADSAFLRSAEWPIVSETVPAIRVADLFSGCGIMSLGAWEAARAIGRRMEPVVALDVNREAIEVYERNFPTVTALTKPVEQFLDGELGKPVTSAEKAFVQCVGNIDLLVGGPPCQGHSNLNNHTRRDDPKNRLYARMARFAALVRPRSIIIENVSAVLHDRGRVVEHTVAALRGLGYEVDCGVAEASDLGVAQRRRRHVLMASLDTVPSVRNTLDLYRRAPRSVEWAIRDLASIRNPVAFDSASTCNSTNRKRIDWLFKHDQHDLPDRLRPDCHRLKDHSYKSAYGRMYWHRPAQTITSGFSSMGQGRYVHPQEPRTLTPHEAARLQFVPDFFSFGEQSGRTALAEMIGNAVPAKLSYVLALELLR